MWATNQGDLDMHVVLDASVICTDFRMRGAPFEMLLAAGARGELSIVVPEVVFLEVVRVYARTFRSYKRNLERQIAGFRRMGLVQAAVGLGIPRNAHDASVSYEGDLRQKLKDVGAEIRPLPFVSHDSILKRALEGRKPMSESERGYRDTLIWETVLEVARQTEKVILLSTNTKDFSDDDALAADLRHDLASNGLPPDRVELFVDLEQFVSERVPLPPPLTWAEEVEAIFEDDPSLLAMFAMHVASLVEYGFPVDLELADSLVFNDASLVSFDGFDVFQLEGVTETLHGPPIVTFEGEGEATIEAFIEKENLESLMPWNRPDVAEFDWQEEVAQVSMTRRIVVTARLPYLGDAEEAFGDVLSLDVDVVGPGSHRPPQAERLF